MTVIRQETWYVLDPNHSMSICRHTDSVTLTNSAALNSGQFGFTIEFRPAHIGKLTELVVELQALKTAQEEKNDDGAT